MTQIKQRYLTTKQAALYTGISEKTLETKRSRDSNFIPFQKIGATVVYDIEKIDIYMDKHTVNSTSQYM